MAKTKWGIMGTGWIAEKFAADLKQVNTAELAAVGSRTSENAQKFAAEHAIPRSYGSYQELVLDSDVDVIYVATPHPFHKENVLTSLRAGKAVLCEKPFTVHSSELEELIQYARENKLFLMEAMWTRFLPSIQKVRQWLAEGKIGEVQLLKADFGFRTDWDPANRLLNPNLGGGALLDAGIYPISFASMVLGTRPDKITSTAYIGSTGVDEQFSVLLSYPNGKTAALNGAVRLNLNNDAYIYGTEGSIYIPNFLMAKTASLFRDNQVVETYTDERSTDGYSFEAEEVSRCIQEGITESSIMPLDESLGIMKIIDEIRTQWELRYPFE